MEYMSIPQTVNIRSASDLFDYDENEALNFRELYSKYKHQLPMLVCIIGGNYGTTKYDCFENLQVLRIHCVSHQKRVAVGDSRKLREDPEGLLTIPENTSVKFRQVYGHGKCGAVKRLSKILEEVETLPINLEINDSPDYMVKIGSSNCHTRDFDYILVKERYEEPFFMLNCIDFTDLKMTSQHCLACLCEDLVAAPIKGFKYPSKLTYKQYCQQLAHQVENSGEVYDVTEGNPDFSEHSLEDLLKLLDVCEVKDGVIIREKLSVAEDTNEEVKPLLPERVRTNVVKDDINDDVNNSDVHPQPETTQPATKSKAPVKSKVPSPTNHKIKDKQHGGKKGLFTTLFSHGIKNTNDGSGKGDVATTVSEKYDDEDDNDDDNDETLPARPAKPVFIDKQKQMTTTTDNKSNICKGGNSDSDESDVYVEPFSPNIIDDKPKDDVLYVECRVNDNDDDSFYVEVHEPETPPSPSLYLTPTSPRALQTPTSPWATQTLNFPPPAPQTPTSQGQKVQVNVVHVRSWEVTGSESVKELSIEGVSTKLKELKLGKYVEIFKDSMIDGSVLCELTVETMTHELEMTRLEAARLSAFIKKGKVPT